MLEQDLSEIYACIQLNEQIMRYFLCANFGLRFEAVLTTCERKHRRTRQPCSQPKKATDYWK